jgi:hypothetical protein
MLVELRIVLQIFHNVLGNVTLICDITRGREKDSDELKTGGVAHVIRSWTDRIRRTDKYTPNAVSEGEVQNELYP